MVSLKRLLQGWQHPAHEHGGDQTRCQPPPRSASPPSANRCPPDGSRLILDLAETERQQPDRQPDKHPARKNWLRRRTLIVMNTPTKPLIRLIARNAGSTRLHRIDPHRLTKIAA